MTIGSQVLASVLAAGVLAGASGCARAHAKAAPENPPLVVPEPPPRDIDSTETIESEPLQPMPLPQEPARTAPPRVRPPAPSPRAEQPRPAEPKEPVASEPPKPEETLRPAEEAPRPPPTLQTTPATEEGEVERNVRAALARAANDLNRIDYRALNADARNQYETAKSFIRQAESAMKSKNLLFAKSLAEKAAALAAQLGAK